MVASLIGAILCFSASAASADEPLKLAGSQLEPVKWSELAGWTADDHLAAFAAYQTSCRALRKIPRTDDSRPIHGALGNVCRKAIALQPQDAHTARAFFEQNFQPVRIARLGEVQGLLTGYFEPIVAGSRFPNPEFPVPLYRRPRDLVAAGYKPGSTAFPNKGVRIGRRTGNNELVPYHDRGAIEAGALDGQKLEICWLKDPFDLLAIQIEGSGRVVLEDGTPVRVNYDPHNGYNYSSVERVLIERNLMSRKEMSRERIRAWMAAHPEEAAKVRATNRAYAFFRVTGLSNEGEPVGAQGVPLTPGRSIAVDRMHEYGTPFFIEANLPIESVKPASPFPPPDDCAGYGIGDRRTGARRSLLGCRRRGRPHRRPHSPSRSLRDAASTRARHGRGRQRDAVAGAEARRDRGRETGRQGQGGARRRSGCHGRQVDAVGGAESKGGRSENGDRRARSQEAGRQRQGGARRFRRDGRPADAAFAGAENEDPRDRNQETGRQGQGGVRQLRRERIGQAYAVACSETEGPGDRSQEAGRQSQSGVRHPRRERDRRQMPLPAPKSKTPGIEIKKQDDKGKAESASVGQIAAGGKQKGRGRAVWGSGPLLFR